MDTVWMLFFTPYDGRVQVLGAFSSLEKAVAERDFWRGEGEGSDYRWFHWHIDYNPLMMRTAQHDMLVIKPLVIDLPISSAQFHRKGNPRPIGVDNDGNGIWQDRNEQYNSGEPLTPDEVLDAQAG